MKKVLIGISTVAAVMGVIACNQASDSSSSNSETATSTYQGAGSKWSLSIGNANTGSFAISKYASAGAATAEMTVTGTYERFTNQFVKLTVTSATGSGAPAAGSLAYGLEVPGYAFFLKPMSGNSEPIVMIQGGNCPSTNFEANWIIAKPRPDLGTIDNTVDMFGRAVINFNGSNSSLVVNQSEPVNGTALTSGGGNGNGTSTLPFDLTTCSNGIIRIADQSEFFDMYFTSSGSVLVKFPSTSGNQIIFASPKTNTAVVQADIAATFSGLVFQEGGSSDNLFPVKLVIPASGNGTGTEIDNVEADSTTTDGIVLSNITNLDGNSVALPTGFFRADLNPIGSTTNGKVSCAFSTVESIKIIACTGYTDNADKKPFFLLARSR